MPDLVIYHHYVPSSGNTNDLGRSNSPCSCYFSFRYSSVPYYPLAPSQVYHSLYYKILYWRHPPKHCLPHRLWLDVSAWSQIHLQSKISACELASDERFQSSPECSRYRQTEPGPTFDGACAPGSASVSTAYVQTCCHPNRQNGPVSYR